MAGGKSTVEGVLTYLLTTIHAKIGEKTTREALIDIHQLVCGNTASVALNLGGGWYGHIVLTMTAKEYKAQMGYAFLPLQNPGNCPPTMVTAQEQALRTEFF